MSITHRRLTASESVVCAELGEEAVLLNVETGIYFGLDAVGARIWALVAEGSPEVQIFDCLLAEYDVEPAALRSDLSAFLDLLEAKGLAQGIGR
jgi:hypothetical protein